MNWKGILWWFVLGLVVFFGVSLLSGLVFGLLKTDASDSVLIRAFGGMVVPFLSFIRFFPNIAATLFIPILIWSLIARRFPALEASKIRLAVSLSLFALTLSVVVWYLFPFDRVLAYWAASFTVLSIIIPRFLTERLSHGKFAA
jgi:hypothetical protein